jgi:type IX secretion system PorP/SprF family membrane protein
MRENLIRLFRKILPGIAFILMSASLAAQQVPMYSQYIMNGFLINPSFTGRDGYTTVNLTVREQWVGMAGSPSTYAASFQTRLLKNSYISKSTSVKKKLVKPTKGGKVGLGGYLFNDNNGIMRRTGFQASYAYHIQMGRTEGLPNNLAFGLAMTGYQYFVNTEGLIYEPNDPFINSFDRSVFVTDFNFGASFTTAKYYAGFAMTNLLRGNLIFGDTSSVDRNELGHFFLTGGIKFPINTDWTIEPSGFIKSSDMLFKSIQMDLTGRVYYKNDYWAGLSYRTGDAIIAMLGLKYDRFYFAYAIDFTLTDIKSATYGTHEITMAVKFGESARRYRWINAY